MEAIFDLSLFRDYGPLILSGLVTTAWICAAANVLGIAVGLVVALCGMLPLAPVRWAARAYIEVMRGLPILILLFLLYYGGPSFGLRLSATTVGVLGLGFYGGGYFAEIFRSGFQSIPKGQIEAARMVGLTGWQVTRRIKLPQMLVLIVPPMVNQIIILIKESALLSIITVAEITKNTSQIVNETYAVVQPYLAAALLYWLLIEGVARAGRVIERRVRF